MSFFTCLCLFIASFYSSLIHDSPYSPSDRTENTVSRFVNFLYEGFPTIPTDPNFSGPVDVVPYQAIPDSYNDLIQNYVRLRRQPHASDRKRPHMITRPPHAPGQTFELVVRFRGEVTDVDLGLLGNWTR